MVKAKQIEGLDCDQSALDGMRLVLLTRLEEMVELRAAALNWSDIEGVHDMRVASRRLRSLLRDFRPHLLRKIDQKRLRKLARTLGTVRDQDVAIAALEALAEEAPEDVVGGVNAIIEGRRRRRDRARASLELVISESSLTRIRYELAYRFEQATRNPARERADETESADTADAETDNLSFRRMGREIILNRFEELRAFGKSLYSPFEVEPLHRMRIAAKRVRYAIELFAQCFGEPLDEFSKEVARIQESLGDLHDCDEWIIGFGQRLRRKRRGRSSDKTDARERIARERCAVVWLLQHFSRERAKHYRHALARWHKWERENFGSRLATILDSEPTFEPADEAQNLAIAECAPMESAPSETQSQQEVL